jgi:catechol 2,3-dioxygenase-like lactoylglutathione lyase family enzyme
MAPALDHTIVPSHNKIESARFISRILGMEYDQPFGHFQPVKAANGLSLAFDEREEFGSHHYAFLVSDEEFDGILQRIKDEGVVYGSGPRELEDGQINHHHHGRGLYFRCPDGHVWEAITHTYTRD